MPAVDKMESSPNPENADWYQKEACTTLHPEPGNHPWSQAHDILLIRAGTVAPRNVLEPI
jgi:hypothetical protein